MDSSSPPGRLSGQASKGRCFIAMHSARAPWRHPPSSAPSVTTIAAKRPMASSPNMYQYVVTT